MSPQAENNMSQCKQAITSGGKYVTTNAAGNGRKHIL